MDWQAVLDRIDERASELDLKLSKNETVRNLRRYLRGTLKSTPTVASMAELARALQTTVSWLLEGGEPGRLPPNSIDEDRLRRFLGLALAAERVSDPDQLVQTVLAFAKQRPRDPSDPEEQIRFLGSIAQARIAQTKK